jgi:enoyl reductase-like protein
VELYGVVRSAVALKGLHRMATPVREYLPSIDQQMLDHLRYSGIERENLTDLVGIFVSLKNKYGLLPLAMDAESHPVPNAVTARYLVDSLTLNKIAHVLWDTPRLNRVVIQPRGIVKSGQFEIAVTLGG